MLMRTRPAAGVELARGLGRCAWCRRPVWPGRPARYAASAVHHVGCFAARQRALLALITASARANGVRDD